MERPRLSNADLEILGFLAEHRVVVIWQVQSLLGAGSRSVAERLQALEGKRLIARQRIFQGQPEACWITRRGLGVIESRLPPPQIDLKGYRHDIGVAWLWLAARGGAFGSLSGQRSERTMRSEDRRADQDGPRYGIGIGELGPGGRPRLHYPDLMLESAAGHRIAVELELTGKGARRLDRIMLGYAADARVDGVVYLCPPGRVGNGVRDAARRMGTGHRVHVQHLAPGSPAGAPDPDPGRGSPTRAPSYRSSAHGAERC